MTDGNGRDALIGLLEMVPEDPLDCATDHLGIDDINDMFQVGVVLLRQQGLDQAQVAHANALVVDVVNQADRVQAVVDALATLLDKGRDLLGQQEIGNVNDQSLLTCTNN